MDNISLDWIKIKADYNSQPMFEPRGSATVVPLIPWLRDCSITINHEVIKTFYKRYYQAELGALDSLSDEDKDSALDFAYTQYIMHEMIMPLLKQSILLHDNVFPLSEYFPDDNKEEPQEISKYDSSYIKIAREKAIQILFFYRQI